MRKLFLLLLTTLSINVFAQIPDQSDELLAFQYYQQGEFDKAAVLYEKLFNAARSEGYFDFYFSALMKMKDYTAAEKVVRKMIKQVPGNPVYTVALGRIYLETGKKAQAEKTFDNAISNMPKEENKIRELANAFYRMESYDVAAKVFVEGRQLLQNEKLFTFDLISIYRYKKDKELLVQEYLSALSYMPEVIFQAQNGIAAIFEGPADYQVLQGLLLKKIQKEPDKEVYTDLLIWQFLQQKDYEMALRQLIAQDKRTKGNGAQIFQAAETFKAFGVYPIAVKAYEYILSKPKDGDYYLPARFEIVNAKYLMLTSGKYEAPAIAELADQYDAILKEYGRTVQTLTALKRWANLQAYYLNDPAKAELALEDALKIPRLSKPEIGQIKLDLGDIYILTGQPWEAVLVYEQVAKDNEGNALVNEANFKAAKVSFYQGNFNFAKSQADVLKGATSQLIANDALNLSLLISDNLQNSTDSLALKMYADAEMLQFMNKIPAALAKLDSIVIKYPGNNLEDDVLMAKAKIYVKRGDFTNATTNLEKLVKDYRESIWTDDGIFTLAELYETRLNESEKAKALYQQLITEFPGSMFTAEARKRFRALRGDAI